MNRRPFGPIAALWLAIGVTAAAQAPPPADPDGPPADPTTPPAETEPGKPGDPPSLDELLGLEPDRQSSSADEAAAREAEEELEQHLGESEVRDAFLVALQKMRLSADLLDQEFDTGLGTQRVQEDILRKLDQLIEYAKKQQSQSSSSSSSSSSSQQQQQQQDQQPNQQPDRGQQQQQQEQSSGQRNQSSGDPGEGEPPAQQDGDINTVLEETRTEWGNLPPRLRKELLQGRDERYSRLYERLTEEYYRKLAEDGS